MDPVHQRFLDNLKRSHGSVKWIASWLHRLGFDVEFGQGVTYSERHADWRRHRDRGDLRVQHPLVGLPERIEVKHRTVRFTGAHDFPYPTMIVCAKHAWDEASPKPGWVLCLNAQGTHVAAIDARHNDGWVVEEKFDKRYHTDEELYRQSFYLVPSTRPFYLPIRESHDAESLRILARQVHQRGFAGIRGQDQGGQNLQRPPAQRSQARDRERPQVDEAARRQLELDECARLFGPPRDR